LSRQKRFLALVLGGAALVTLAGVAAAALLEGPDNPLASNEQVTICHATGSATNPFVQLRDPVKQLFSENGHANHANDIIPSFYYLDDNGDRQFYPGKNWDAEGQAIWANGCRSPEAPTLPIQPSVKCVDVDGGNLTAVFGYSNPNAAAVDLAAGSGFNFINPGGNRGQPSTFLPGTVESAVTVTADAGTTITWTISYAGQASSASADASFPTRCTTPPSPTPSIQIFVKCVDNSGSTFSATFGYLSSATGVVDIPVGSNNSLDPSSYGSPPTSFQPGGEHTFTIAGITNGTNLVWTLNTDEPRTASATADFPTKCTPPPPTPIRVSVTCIDDHGGTFSATFGYTNDNPAAVDVPASDSVLTTVPPTATAPPTHFQTGTVTNAFSVSGAAGSDIRWSVSFAGVTSVAVANESFPTKCGVEPVPHRVGIFVTCVTNQGSTYSATFGYENEGTEPTNIPVGEGNRFSPAPQNRGQPTTFEAGNVPEAFTVNDVSASTALTWALTTDQARFAEASADFPTKCPGPPPDLVPIGLFVTCVTNHAGMYDAVFGYTNDNPAEQIIPLGFANTFAPAPGNRGQPTTFEPGTVRDAVTVRGIPNETALVWSVFHVRARVAVANPNLPEKCKEPPVTPPPPPPPPEHGLFATCVLRLGAPTYTAIFGYANGSEDDVIIPIGRRNHVAPTPIDRGQPTVFRPGVTLVAFTVHNVPRTRDLTWTVRLANGEVRTATASARYPRDCITAPAPPAADLVLTKTASPTHVDAGQRVTFTIHVINRGPNIALRIRVTDRLDLRLELLSASTSRGSCTTSGQRVSCRVVEFPPGAAMTITVAARARGGGTIRNTAVATHSRRDPTPRNNVDSAVVTVRGGAGAVSPAFTG
jgi:uncharacterized repeat protein (TIGR01451 family)